MFFLVYIHFALRLPCSIFPFIYRPGHTLSGDPRFRSPLSLVHMIISVSESFVKLPSYDSVCKLGHHRI